MYYTENIFLAVELLEKTHKELTTLAAKYLMVSEFSIISLCSSLQRDLCFRS